MTDFFLLKCSNLKQKIRTNSKKLFYPCLPRPQISDKKLLNQAKERFSCVRDLASFIKKKTPPIFGLNPDQVHIIKKNNPAAIENTILSADKIRKHIFDLLGYSNLQLDDKISWHSDPRFKDKSWSGYYLNIECLNLDEPTDMRIAWELSRFCHAITLGKAYRYTKNEKYAREFTAQLEDWLTQNPPQWGINWICTMEIALRAVNLIWAYYFFLDTDNFSLNLQTKLIKSLIQHAQHIESNLEGTPYGIYSNHYISNGLGLFVLGLFLSDFKMGDRWLSQGLDILWREAQKQIYPDGPDYEQSIDYHGQVLSFYLLAIVLCRKNGIEIPVVILKRIEKMLEFTLSYTRQDGSVPMIGDADSGKLWTVGDNTHLACLAVGTVIFSRADFSVPLAGKFSESALWLLGTEGLGEYNLLINKSSFSQPGSRGFKQAGFYIMRHNDLHMSIHCSKYGAHGHNDLLSIDLSAFGSQLLADPGAYTYTGSYKWKNYFRSNFSHNIVRVDEADIHPLSRDTIWSIKGENKYKLNKWVSKDEYDFFDGEHYCYHRLGQKVTHRRRILFDKMEGFFIIYDSITGMGEHKLELIFNLAPIIKVELSADKSASCRADDKTGLLIIQYKPKELTSKLTEGWFSPVYGKKIPTQKIIYSKMSALPADFFTILYPYQGAPDKSIVKLRQQAKAAWDNK